MNYEIMKGVPSVKILGIVAEYDPFHRGHLFHLREAQKQVLPDLTFVALSPCFKQRGELSLLSPADRARCALEAGADAVFSLPVCWTLRDAEHYALGSVALLANLGANFLHQQMFLNYLLGSVRLEKRRSIKYMIQLVVPAPFC